MLGFSWQIVPESAEHWIFFLAHAQIFFYASYRIFGPAAARWYFGAKPYTVIRNLAPFSVSFFSMSASSIFFVAFDDRAFLNLKKKEGGGFIGS